VARDREGPLGEAQRVVATEARSLVERMDEVDQARWAPRVLSYARCARTDALAALAYADLGEPIAGAPYLAAALAWEQVAGLPEAEWRAGVDAAAAGAGPGPLLAALGAAATRVHGLHPALRGRVGYTARPTRRPSFQTPPRIGRAAPPHGSPVERAGGAVRGPGASDGSESPPRAPYRVGGER
jgi:hypothetical protein